MPKEADIRDKLIIQEDDNSKKEETGYTFDGLTSLAIWGYSMGHLFNDL